jgi:hypothetical protein
MSNGEYTIEPVKIMLVTNIPNKEPIPFTSDLLYHPFLEPNLRKYKLKKYPSVVSEGLEYDTSLLNKLDYSRRVRFFFEPDYMRKKLAELNRDGNMTSKSDVKIKNIDVLIKLLFQTKYPVIEDIGSSYCQNITTGDDECSKSKFTSKGSVPQVVIDLAPGLFKGLETYYSYLKTDGSIYTVIKALWLNDVINHPFYRTLIDQYIFFKKWWEKEKANIQTVLRKQEATLGRIANENISKKLVRTSKCIGTKKRPRSFKPAID